MGLYQELGIRDTMSDAELATYLASVRREWSRRLLSKDPLERQRAEQQLRKIDVLANAEARLGNFPRPALVMKTLCAAMDHGCPDYYGLEEGLVRSCSRGVFRGEFRSVLSYLSGIGEEPLVQEWTKTLTQLHYSFDAPRPRPAQDQNIRASEQGSSDRRPLPKKASGQKSSGKKTPDKRSSDKRPSVRETSAGIRLQDLSTSLGELFHRASRRIKRFFRELRRRKIPVRLIAVIAAAAAALVLMFAGIRHISAVRKAEAEAKAQAEAEAAAAQEAEAQARKAQEELLAGLEGMADYTLSVNENAAVSYQRADPVSCTASSELVGLSGTVYGTANLFDENTETSWQEGEEGDGIGVTITSVFGSRTNLKAIAFYNGNQISQERLEANNRLENITITVGCEGESHAQQYTLQDTLGEQDIVFDAPVPAESVTIQIDSVYQGSIYQDTVLTGLYFYTGT